VFEIDQFRLLKDAVDAPEHLEPPKAKKTYDIWKHHHNN